MVCGFVLRVLSWGVTSRISFYRYMCVRVCVIVFFFFAAVWGIYNAKIEMRLWVLRGALSCIAFLFSFAAVQSNVLYYTLKTRAHTFLLPCEGICSGTKYDVPSILFVGLCFLRTPL